MPTHCQTANNKADKGSSLSLDKLDTDEDWNLKLKKEMYSFRSHSSQQAGEREDEYNSIRDIGSRIAHHYNPSNRVGVGVVGC